MVDANICQYLLDQKLPWNADCCKAMGAKAPADKCDDGKRTSIIQGTVETQAGGTTIFEGGRKISTITNDHVINKGGLNCYGDCGNYRLVLLL